MALPVVDFDFYADEHRGTMGKEAFEAALPMALARLSALTGADVPAAWADAWRHAACAIADRVGGADTAGAYTSERVGETSLTYSEAWLSAQAATDYDLALPWLSGSGLLCSVMRCHG